MADKPVFKVVPSPTNSNWKIQREGEETPLLFVDSKEDAMQQAKKMADEHGGKVIVGGEKAKKKAPAKKKTAKKKAA
jgi:hypothetical protein